MDQLVRPAPAEDRLERVRAMARQADGIRCVVSGEALAKPLAARPQDQHGVALAKAAGDVADARWQQ